MGQGFAGSLIARRSEDVCDILPGKPLGHGTFGVVWRGRLKNGGGTVAVKVMDKWKMREMLVQPGQALSEVALMKECRQRERIVQLYDFVDTRDKYILILEFCDGGNLEAATRKQGEGALGEQQVVRLMGQMLEGVAFLHSRHICHRDIKPQNVMMVGSSSSEQVKVKLGDFGIAVRLRPGQLLREKVGTPLFMAPEMHLLPRSTGYDNGVDMWAIGAVMVFLLAHEYPFVDGAGRLLHDQLLRGDLPLWDTDIFSGLFQRVKEVAGVRSKLPSSIARDLVHQLLMPQREHRLCARQALQHDWFKHLRPAAVALGSRRRTPPRCGADQAAAGGDVPLLLCQAATSRRPFTTRPAAQQLPQVKLVEAEISADQDVGALPVVAAAAPSPVRRRRHCAPMRPGLWEGQQLSVPVDVLPPPSPGSATKAAATKVPVDVLPPPSPGSATKAIATKVPVDVLLPPSPGSATKAVAIKAIPTPTRSRWPPPMPPQETTRVPLHSRSPNRQAI